MKSNIIRHSLELYGLLPSHLSEVVLTGQEVYLGMWIVCSDSPRISLSLGPRCSLSIDDSENIVVADCLFEKIRGFIISLKILGCEKFKEIHRSPQNTEDLDEIVLG